MNAPQPDDLEPLILRCAMAIDLGVDDDSILQLCHDEGQSPECAYLILQAAILFSKWSHS